MFPVAELGACICRRAHPNLKLWTRAGRPSMGDYSGLWVAAERTVGEWLPTFSRETNDVGFEPLAAKR